MANKKLVALQIKDARQAGYAAVWERVNAVATDSDSVPLWLVWRAMYAYQEATERALLGDDALPPGDVSR
jgi:hypothetical protein